MRVMDGRPTGGRAGEVLVVLSCVGGARLCWLGWCKAVMPNNIGGITFVCI